MLKLLIEEEASLQAKVKNFEIPPKKKERKPLRNTEEFSCIENLVETQRVEKINS